MSGSKDNVAWKQKGLPAGLSWMIDVIWANLTSKERVELHDILAYHPYYPYDPLVTPDKWLHIQLLHNFGDCFTEESKKKVNWMLHPRTANW